MPGDNDQQHPERHEDADRGAEHPVEHEREQLPHRREREEPEVPDEQYRDRCNAGEGEDAVLPEKQEGAADEDRDQEQKCGADDHLDRPHRLPQTVLLLLDSGGVRLQEANAGELAVAELMRAIVQARCAGVAVIALVGGKFGAFGGAGLTAATCSRIVISEQGRIGVSGPEVIETNKGVEEFDAQDKALVWSTDGGKNRRLIGGADAFSEDSMDGFRAAAEAALAKVPSFDLKTMQAEQERLTARQQRLGACDDAVSMWRILGIKDPEAVRDMDGKDLTALTNGIKEANHDAR